MNNNSQFYITDENDIYLYFQIISMLNPKSIIDIGMFLRRIGVISRQVKGAMIDRNIVIDAVNVSEIYYPEVYRVIYNGIKNDLSESIQYDLGIIIKIKELLSKEKYDEIIRWCLNNTRFTLIDDQIEFEDYGVVVERVQVLQIDDNKYYLIQR